MEVIQMLAMHSMLVQIFLGFLVVGLLTPLLIKSPTGFKKASLIYTMLFQALASMIAFAGIVAVFTGDLAWSMSTILMVVIWAAMMFIEIKKYNLVKTAHLQNENTFNVLRGAFIKISIVQILLVAIMVILMVLKAKGVISI
jgi:hypothetical protein